MCFGSVFMVATQKLSLLVKIFAQSVFMRTDRIVVQDTENAPSHIRTCVIQGEEEAFSDGMLQSCADDIYNKVGKRWTVCFFFCKILSKMNVNC